MLRVLSRSYGLGTEQHANLSAEKIKKNLDPLAVRHAGINSKTIVKCAFEDANLVAGAEFRALVELYVSGCVLAALERADHRIGYRHRAIAVANKA